MESLAISLLTAGECLNPYLALNLEVIKLLYLLEI
jgi:hypothetical protein